MCIGQGAAGDDSRFWLGFAHVRGIGPERLRRLLDAFGTAESAWRADAARLARVLEPGAVRSLTDTRASLDLGAAMARVERCGARLVTWQTDDYPELLRSIPSPPFALFVVGDVGRLSAPSVAVVGTRDATPYGLRAARWLAGDLARYGLCVVSGLAVGIDTAAHEAAIEAAGTTVAVLGCGVDIAYPWLNRGLARRIAVGGALVSEYPPGTRPAPAHFRIRNRIVSGLSRATVVVEAGVASGALITAGHAADQGREVMAVPGSVFSGSSAGCHRLLETGAGIARSAIDVLRALGIDTDGAEDTARARPADRDQAAILDLLCAEPRHVDDLCRATGLAAQEVVRALTMMELSAMVMHVGQMRWVAVP